MDLLTLGWMTTLVLLCVALWDLRRTPAPVIA
jgi:hypothetical protein